MRSRGFLNVENAEFALPFDLRPPLNRFDEVTLWKLVLSNNKVEIDFKNLENAYKRVIQAQEERLCCFDKFDAALKELGDRVVAVSKNSSQAEKIADKVSSFNVQLENIRELLKRERLRFKKSLKDAKHYIRKLNLAKTETDIIPFKDKLKACLENILTDLETIEKTFLNIRELILQIHVYSEVINEIEKYEDAETEMWKMLLDISLEIFKFSRFVPAHLQLLKQIIDMSLNNARKISQNYKTRLEIINRILDSIDSCLGSFSIERLSKKRGKCIVVEIWRGKNEKRFWDVKKYKSPDLTVEDIKQMIQTYAAILKSMMEPVRWSTKNSHEWVHVEMESEQMIKTLPKKIAQLEHILKNVSNMVKFEYEENEKRQNETRKERTNISVAPVTSGVTEEVGARGTVRTDSCGGLTIHTRNDLITGTNNNIISDARERERERERGNGLTTDDSKEDVDVGKQPKKVSTKLIKNWRSQKILEYLSVVGNELYCMLPLLHDMERAREFDKISDYLYNQFEKNIPNAVVRNNLIFSLLTSLHHSITTIPHILNAFNRVINYDRWEKTYLEEMICYALRKTESITVHLLTAQGLHSMSLTPKKTDVEAKGIGKTVIFYITEILTSMEEMDAEAKAAGEHIKKLETYVHQPVEATSFITLISESVNKLENIIALYGIASADLLIDLKKLPNRKVGFETTFEKLCEKKVNVQTKLKTIRAKLRRININTSRKEFQMYKTEIFKVFESLVPEAKTFLIPNCYILAESVDIDAETSNIRQHIVELQSRALDYIDYSQRYQKGISEGLKGSVTGINDVFNKPTYLNQIDRCYNLLISFLNDNLIDAKNGIKKAEMLTLEWETILAAKTEEMKEQKETKETNHKWQNFEEEIKLYISDIQKLVENMEATIKALHRRAENTFDELIHLSWSIQDCVNLRAYQDIKVMIEKKIEVIKDLLKNTTLIKENSKEKKTQSQLQLHNEKQKLKNAKLGLITFTELLTTMIQYVQELKGIEQYLEHNIRVSSILMELRANAHTAQEKINYFKTVLEYIAVKALKEEFTLGELTINMFLYEKTKLYASQKFLLHQELILLKIDLANEIKIIEHCTLGRSHLQHFLHEIATRITMLTMRRHFLTERIAMLKNSVREIIRQRKVDIEAKAVEFILTRLLNTEKNTLRCIDHIYSGLKQTVLPIKGSKEIFRKNLDSLLEAKKTIKQKLAQLQIELSSTTLVNTQDKMNTLIKNMKNDIEDIQRLNKKIFPDFQDMKNVKLTVKHFHIYLKLFGSYSSNIKILKSASKKKIKELLRAIEYSVNFYAIIHNEMITLSDKNLYPLERQNDENFTTMIDMTKIYANALKRSPSPSETKNEEKKDNEDAIKNKKGNEYLKTQIFKMNRIVFCKAVLRSLERELCESQCVYKCAEITLSNLLKYRDELREACEDMNKKKDILHEQIKQLRKIIDELQRLYDLSKKKTYLVNDMISTQQEMIKCVCSSLDLAKKVNEDIRVVKINFQYFLHSQMIMKSMNNQKHIVKDQLRYIQAQYNFLKQVVQCYANELSNIELESSIRPKLAPVITLEVKEAKQIITYLNNMLCLAAKFRTFIEKARKQPSYLLYIVETQIVLAIDIAEKVKIIKPYFTDRFRPLMHAMRQSEKELTKQINAFINKDKETEKKLKKEKKFKRLLQQENKILEEERKYVETEREASKRLETSSLFKVTRNSYINEIRPQQNKAYLSIILNKLNIPLTENRDMSKLITRNAPVDVVHATVLNLESLGTLDNSKGQIDLKYKNKGNSDAFSILKTDAFDTKLPWNLLYASM